MSSKIKEVYKKDATINNIHMSWGWDLPATDIDCLFVEYNYPNNPAALIEYKHQNWNRDFTKGPIRTIHALANKADLPFFVVIWNNKPEVTFEIYCMNNQARSQHLDYNVFLKVLENKELVKEAQQITEKQYIDFMTFIRRQKNDTIS